MIRLRKRLGEIIAVIIGAIVLLLPTTVFAKTVFTVPSFNQTHSNDIYHNGNLIIAAQNNARERRRRHSKPE